MANSRAAATSPQLQHPLLSKRLGSRGEAICLICFLAAVGWVLSWRFAAIPAGADSGGYINSARLLADGRLQAEPRVLPEWPLSEAAPFAYVPLGFVDSSRTGKLTPTYPVGLPLHYAVAGRLLGWRIGIAAVGIALALFGLGCTYWLARELECPPPLALGATALLAMSPMFLWTSLVPLSDTVAMAWCTATMLCALRSRRRSMAAWCCGLAFSIAVLVRPTNIILAPALVLAVWDWRLLLRVGMAAIPGFAFGAWYNHALYGHVSSTGYGSVDNLFTVANLAPALRNYVVNLPQVLPLVIVAIAVAPWLPWRSQSRVLWACVAWFGAFLGFYAWYYYTGEFWWYLRFVLPAFPAAVVVAAAALSAIARRADVAPGARVAVVAVVVVAAAAVSLRYDATHHVLKFPDEQRPHERIAQWLKANVPSNSAVLCFHLSSAMYYYTDLTILRSDQFSPDEFRRFAAATGRADRPVYAAIFNFQQAETFRDNIPGDWRKVAEIDNATIWKLETTP